MLRSPTTRIIQHRPRRLHVFYGAVLKRNRRTGALRHFSSSVATTTTQLSGVHNNNNDDESSHYRYVYGVPQSIQVRSFATTTAAGGGSSLRERATESALRAQASARRGAKVAQKGAYTMAEMARQYGPVFIGTYAGMYIGTLASIYGGIQSGALEPVALMDWIHPPAGESPASTVHMVVDLMEQYSFTKPYAPMLEEHPYVANFAVAWIAAKFTEPIRLAATIAVTPRLARYFGYVSPKQVEDGEESGKSTQESPGGSVEEVTEAGEAQDGTKAMDSESSKKEA